ncbi:MerR family transcriptional regulator [Myxococcaceae bacterium GXIMD 01537]
MSTPKTTQSGWKLGELASAVGISPRTVRYYVQRGLLPAPAFRGPDTVYGEEHLLRLKAIRVLQGRFLPLDAIQAELARLSPDALRALAEEEVSAAPPPPPAPAPTQRVERREVDTCLPESPADSQVGVAGYRRWELAPGLELHLADAAEEQVRALAERVRAFIEQSRERKTS